MHFKKYPKYKDSGVEWLGKIPEKWKTTQLRRIAKIVNGSTPKTLYKNYWDGNINWFTPEDLGKCCSKFIENPKRKITKEGYKSCGTKLVPENSLILSTRAPIGHFALLNDDACFNQGCKGLIFKKELFPSYYYYYLLSVKNALESWGQGSTFTELKRANLASFFALYPDINDQKKISDFLDQKTFKIDQLIQKNKKLIELLKEKRQAIITQAVTKGLNQNVEMKNSGIEWLGKIPQDWKIKRLRYYFNLHSSGVWGEEQKDNNNDMVCVRVADFDFDRFSIKKDNLTIRNIPSSKFSKILENGDILLEKSGGGEKQPVGRAVKFNLGKKAVCSNFIERLEINNNYSPSYVSYLLGCLYFRSLNVRSIRQTTGIQNLDMYSYFCEGVPFPFLKMQQTIANFLDQKTAKIDVLVGKIGNQIEKLQEYRQALISNVVTGKVKV